jgi:hypothetical protein
MALPKHHASKLFKKINGNLSHDQLLSTLHRGYLLKIKPRTLTTEKSKSNNNNPSTEWTQYDPTKTPPVWKGSITHSNQKKVSGKVVAIAFGAILILWVTETIFSPIWKVGRPEPEDQKEIKADEEFIPRRKSPKS